MASKKVNPSAAAYTYSVVSPLLKPFRIRIDKQILIYITMRHNNILREGINSTRL